MEERCAWFLSIGMTSEEFWEKPHWLCRAYMKKARIDRDNRNFYEWLQGLYAYNAFAAVITSAFSKKKGEYPEKPFPMGDEQKKEDAATSAASAFEVFAAAFNAARAKAVDNG